MARGLAAAVDLLAIAVGSRPLRMLGPTAWAPPLGDERWAEVVDLCLEWFGPFDSAAVYRPRQTERSGAAILLLRQGTGVGFVKLRPQESFEREVEVLGALAGSQTFRVPEVRGLEAVGGGWVVLGLTAVGTGRMSPRLSKPPHEIAAEVSRRLAKVQFTGGDARSHWAPMHGDMGPWNLRRDRHGGTVLYDWEHVALAPPGADLVFHSAACRAMHIGGSADVTGLDEAQEYWLTEIPRRFGSGSTDQRLAREMLASLEKRQD